MKKLEDEVPGYKEHLQSQVNAFGVKLNEQALLSAQLLNSLNGRLPHFIETLRQIMFSVKELNKMFIVYQPLFL